MKRAYKYKLKPTMKQQRKLLQFFGCARFIYNWGLDRKVKAYKEDGKNLTYIQLARELTLLKKEEGKEWLNDCANVCLQQSLRNLDNAYTRFFKEKKGFPKFKRKGKCRDACKFIESVRFDFQNLKVVVPKIGTVKLCENKAFDSEGVKLGTLTVYRDKCGEYWCSIVVDDGQETRPKAKVSVETAVGIDLGIKDYAVLSDGTKYGNPKHLSSALKRVKLLNRRFSRTCKGSKRHEAARLKLAKCYRDIANRRSDFLHKLTTDIVSRFDTICIEDLNVEGMIKNHNLARCIQDASWREFRRQLEYKSEWHGKNVIAIGRFEPSSQICSDCGCRNAEIKNLAIREWTCPECGAVHDRDVNAARNILSFGLHPQAVVGEVPFRERMRYLENIDRPPVSGLMDVEGNGAGRPAKRQDSKPKCP